MNPLASRSERRGHFAPRGRTSFGAAVSPDALPGLAPEHANMLRRVGVLTQARLAAANITLLVARIWDDYEVEPSDRVAPSASTISGWVQQARMLGDANLH